MITNCPVCGKLTCIHWPEHWVYRRGETYYCSANCMDVDMVRDYNAIKEAINRRKDLAMRKITLEQKQRAVEIALSGENPLEFLRNCGSQAPDKTWWAIKAALKEKDPDTYARIPDFRQKTGTALPEPEQAATAEPNEPEKEEIVLVYDESIKEEYRRELAQREANERAQNEASLAEDPEETEIPPEDEADGGELWETTAIRNRKLGEFYYDRKFRTIDWRHPYGEEVSLPPAEWKRLAAALPDILKRLGADMYE